MRPNLPRSRWWIAGAIAWATLAASAGLVVELYKVDVREQSHIVNASARGRMGKGAATLTEGFIIAQRPQTVVVRALGPSLRRFGLKGSREAPLLRVLRNSDGKEMGSNRGGLDPLDPRLRGDLSRYAPPDSREAACVLSLNPGAYTATAEGPANGCGLGMIEIFGVR